MNLLINLTAIIVFGGLLYVVYDIVTHDKKKKES